MKKIILSACALLFSLCMFGQDVPGYQGKKQSVGYAASVSMAATQVNSSGHFTSIASSLIGVEMDDKYAATAAFNITHSLNYNRVVNRYRSFFAAASYMSSACYFSDFSSYDETSFISYASPACIGKMTGFGAEIGVKKYTYGLAPLGYYFANKIGFNMYSAEIPVMKAVTGAPMTPEFKKSMVFSPRFVYSFGKQNVFGDSFLYDYSVDLDCVAPLRLALSEIQSSKTGSTSNKAVAGLRASFRDCFVFHFGLSYLF